MNNSQLVANLFSLCETQRRLAGEADNENERKRLLKEAEWHQQWAERENK
jgi:hypothetical protein